MSIAFLVFNQKEDEGSVDIIGPVRKNFNGAVKQAKKAMKDIPGRWYRSKAEETIDGVGKCVRAWHNKDRQVFVMCGPVI